MFARNLFECVNREMRKEERKKERDKHHWTSVTLLTILALRTHHVSTHTIIKLKKRWEKSERREEKVKRRGEKERTKARRKSSSLVYAIIQRSGSALLSDS